MSWNLLKYLSAACLCILQDRLPYEGSQRLDTIAVKLDVSCIFRTWKIKGIMVCPGSWKPSLFVENAYPCGILEVVRQPGRTHLVGMPRGITGGLTSGHNEGGLQFADTRVFTFIPRFPAALQIPLAIPGGPLFGVNYVSELDGYGWRTGLLDLLFASDSECAGAWGCYSPRSGFIQQPSEPIAAHVQALRAGRVAFQPRGRVVLDQYPFEPRTGHYLQLISPVRRKAISIGHPDLRLLEM